MSKLEHLMHTLHQVAPLDWEAMLRKRYPSLHHAEVLAVWFWEIFATPHREIWPQYGKFLAIATDLFRSVIDESRSFGEVIIAWKPENSTEKAIKSIFQEALNKRGEDFIMARVDRWQSAEIFSWRQWYLMNTFVRNHLSQEPHFPKELLKNINDTSNDLASYFVNDKHIDPFKPLTASQRVLFVDFLVATFAPEYELPLNAQDNASTIHRDARFKARILATQKILHYHHQLRNVEWLAYGWQAVEINKFKPRKKIEDYVLQQCNAIAQAYQLKADPQVYTTYLIESGYHRYL